MQKIRLYLIGDHTYNIRLHFERLFRRNDDCLLKTFSNRVFNALGAEISKLPLHISDGFPQFSYFEDLLEWSKTGNPCVPLDMTLTCMYQIRIFIRYILLDDIVYQSTLFMRPTEADFDHDKQQSRESDPYNGTKKSIVIGLSTGALAAAAIVCSSNLVNLVPLAVDAVITAFRIGVRVAELAKRVAPFDGADQSWSIKVSDLASADAIHQFCQNTVTDVLSLYPFRSNLI